MSIESTGELLQRACIAETNAYLQQMSAFERHAIVAMDGNKSFGGQGLLGKETVLDLRNRAARYEGKANAFDGLAALFQTAKNPNEMAYAFSKLALLLEELPMPPIYIANAVQQAKQEFQSNPGNSPVQNAFAGLLKMVNHVAHVKQSPEPIINRQSFFKAEPASPRDEGEPQITPKSPS